MTTHATEAILDADPYVSNHPQARPFWQAAAQGVFLLPHCRACGRAHWYPRPFCPHCDGDSVAWQPASGLGSLYACSMLRRVTPARIMAYVQVQEGPILLTNMVDCRIEDLRIDMPVDVTFRPAKEGRCVPVFRPAG